MTPELLKRIKEILLHDWDPIMVGENPLLDDEYDNYAREIYRLFVAGKPSREALYEYLQRSEGEDIGMSVEDEKRMAVVTKLLCLG